MVLAYLLLLPLLQIKVTDYAGGPHRVHVLGDLFRSLDTFWAPEQMFLQWGKLRLVLDPAEVVAFQTVIVNVFHAEVVREPRQNSKEYLFGDPRSSPRSQKKTLAP